VLQQGDDIFPRSDPQQFVQLLDGSEVLRFSETENREDWEVEVKRYDLTLSRIPPRATM